MSLIYWLRSHPVQSGISDRAYFLAASESIFPLLKCFLSRLKLYFQYSCNYDSCKLKKKFLSFFHFAKYKQKHFYV